MSTQLSEYVRITKYAQYNKEFKRRETWEEQVERVFNMHRVKFSKFLDNDYFTDAFQRAKKHVLNKTVLGSQRALQFGGPSILNKNTRIYNCAVTYIDRPKAFQETMFVLLCGSGVGFSVQYKHVNNLPTITSVCDDEKNQVTFVVPDTIEGWADSIGVLMSSYFSKNQPFPEYYGKNVVFDFSKVRPKGSPISFTNGKAPGPDGLKASLEKIRTVLNKAVKSSDRLTPIQVYDIVMHTSDAVLSGGVRRSATICIFSDNDNEMLTAKTGDWYIQNPQRGRSNNSVLLLRDQTTFKRFSEIMDSVKQFGEPGFIWADDEDSLYNPCCEINMYAYNSKGESGFSFCNLCEINMSNVKSKYDFFDRCEAASIIGTLQAAYTDFGYLGNVTREIVEREALIGVGMTGMMDNPLISFDKTVLSEGAKVVKETNMWLSKLIGINQAARTTCVKPAGTTSCLLECSSGIHPQHAKRYFRRVQSNKSEEPLKFFKQYNPKAVVESVWSTNKTDDVITFLCTPPDGAITRDQLSAIDMLEKVKLVQKYWVEAGKNEELCVRNWLQHNVSNTVNIRDDEWKQVTDHIFENRGSFAGISLLPFSGDLIYPQAPLQEVLTCDEIVKRYGDGALLSSGLIVHALEVFGDLHSACSCLLGTGERLEYPKLDNIDGQSLMDADNTFKKIRWVAQGKKFSKNYFGGDLVKMTQCLKLVDSWKTWLDLERAYKDVPWSKLIETDVSIDSASYPVCTGGQCEIIRF
jgi:ribonucleoside-diphosphate reductase alpha chain